MAWLNPELKQHIEGQKIKSVRYSTEEERKMLYIEKFIVIELEDGSTLAVLRDDEGNGPGALHLMKVGN